VQPSVPDLGGWTPLDSLTVGSRIAVPPRLPAPIGAGLGWSEHRLGLLAYLLGDGCVLARQPIHDTSQDEANLEFVDRRPAPSLHHRSPSRAGNWWHTYLRSPFLLTHGRRNPIAQWFHDLGIANLRHLRSDYLTSCTPRRQGDPHVSAPPLGRRRFGERPTGRTGRTGARIYYSTSSRELADGSFTC